MKTWSVVLGVSFWVMGLLPSEVGPAYPSNGFLPAAEGGTPDCVQDPRETFCVNPKKYPKERILYLLENRMFNLDSLLMDETRDSYTFEAKVPPSKPPPMMYGYEPPRQSYGPPPRPSQSYGPPPPSRPSLGYLPPPPANTSTSKPYHKYGPPLAPPPRPPPSTRHYGQSTPTNLYQPPTAPVYESEASYPRYPPKAPPPPSGPYLSRYLPPPPRSQPKHQPWYRKILRSSRRRQRRQALTMDLCPYDSKFIMPRAALNNRGSWMFIVNLEEVSATYTQLVESKTCISNTCSGICDVPDGFSAVCQQQYVQKRLIALEESGAMLATDTFWFPSCCVCKLRPN